MTRPSPAQKLMLYALFAKADADGFGIINRGTGLFEAYPGMEDAAAEHIGKAR